MLFKENKRKEERRDLELFGEFLARADLEEATRSVGLLNKTRSWMLLGALEYKLSHLNRFNYNIIVTFTKRNEKER